MKGRHVVGSSSFFEKKEPKKLLSVLASVRGKARQFEAAMRVRVEPVEDLTGLGAHRAPGGEKFFWFFFFKKRTACLPAACLDGLPA
jgi:hypothetical protein